MSPLISRISFRFGSRGFQPSAASSSPFTDKEWKSQHIIFCPINTYFSKYILNERIRQINISTYYLTNLKLPDLKILLVSNWIFV